MQNQVFISKSTEDFREKFLKWKEAFESGITKVMISGSKEEILKSKTDPSAKCGERAVANSVLLHQVR